MPALSVAERQRKSRNNPNVRPISLVIRDPKAIKALDKLVKQEGSIRAAIEQALIFRAAKA